MFEHTGSIHQAPVRNPTTNNEQTPQEMLNPGDYLYGFQGPWPAESPVWPGELPPIATLLPDQEIRAHKDVTVSRYLRQVKYGWFSALVRAWRTQRLEEVTDAELLRLVLETPFGRFLHPKLDPVDHQTFAHILPKHDDADEIYKIDFSAMSLITPLPEVYAAPTITLLKREAGELHLLACAIEGIVVEPGDGHAWELTKHFIVQGAAIHLIEMAHPQIHQPMSAANAISKTTLPKSHPLLQLLLPHLELQLPIDCAATYRQESVALNQQQRCYTPFPDEPGGIYHLIRAGYRGIAGNSSYQAYRFQLDPAQIHTDYGVFLSRYHDTVLRFVQSVSGPLGLSPADPQIRRWADSCARFIPGFPDAAAIQNPGVLERTVASMISHYSVIHTSDHFSVAEVPLSRLSLRLRVPPPTSRRIPAFDRKHLRTVDDNFRHHLAHEMFIKPTIIHGLGDIDYGFEDSTLQGLNHNFRDALRETDRTMPVKRYAPLSDIATSIQF